MPSVKQLVGVAVGLASVASALPGLPMLSERRALYERAIDPATGIASGIGDTDVLQFALTAEFLETSFYQQGFQQFPASDFLALGLQQADVDNLISIGSSEQEHVEFLLSAISATGTAPVAPCTYKFGFTTAAAMVATAAVLENIGVSAYLGAAGLVSDKSILTAAAQILTVEARHQTFVRTASKMAAVPSAFDTPLSVRSVFTLAAQFIDSCPDGSNLEITPFSALTLGGSAPSGNVAAGTNLQLSTTGSGAAFCTFVAAGNPGGSISTAFTNGACDTPQNLAGIGYVFLTSAVPAGGAITDDLVVAGPMPMQFS